MPRPPRLEIPGVPLHVIQRGVNRSSCFFTDVDRRFYLKCLAKYAGQRQVAVHAYVLMGNHVHLLVTPRFEGGVAAMIQDMGRTYVRTINSLHGRTGTLWEGRFKSSLVDTETYLMACHRYIELNPVRAGMTRRASEYPWSSHAHHAGGERNPLITEHESYRVLGNGCESRQRNFSSLFDCPVPEEQVELIRRSANANAAIGSREFLERLSLQVGRYVGLPPKGRPPKAPEVRVINKLL
jgi:putative transposase